MSLIHSFLTEPPLVITRQLLVIALVVVLATVATLLFDGPGGGLPFDTSIDQVPLPF